MIIASNPSNELLVLTRGSDGPCARCPSCGHSGDTTERPAIHTTEVEQRPLDLHEAGQELTDSLGDQEPLDGPKSTPVWMDSSTSGNALVPLESGQSHPSDLIGITCTGDASNVVSRNEIDIASSLLTFSEPSWLNLDSLPHPSNSAPSFSRRYPHSFFSDHLDFIQKLLQQNGYAEKHLR